VAIAETAERPNQKRRTRKDLLQAAARLLKRGRRPSLEEVDFKIGREHVPVGEDLLRQPQSHAASASPDLETVTPRTSTKSYQVLLGACVERRLQAG